MQIASSTTFTRVIESLSHNNECFNIHTHTLTHTHIRVVPSISFQTFLYRHLKLSQTLENSLCYCYTSYEMTDQMNKWLTNEQLQQELEYTLLKPDCHSWWNSKIQSGREDTLEKRYAIEFCFKLGKNATETYGMLQTTFWPSCLNRASVFEWHKRFKVGNQSVRDDERCGRSKEVNTPELIGQRVRVRVTILRF